MVGLQHLHRDAALGQPGVLHGLPHAGHVGRPGQVPVGSGEVAEHAEADGLLPLGSGAAGAEQGPAPRPTPRC